MHILNLGAIAGIVPFSDALDRSSASLPEPLERLLFGTPTERHTYALLDASRFFGLPELLEGSGLAHRMLLPRGKNDELRDVAPYVVELTPASRFARHLFTEGDSP